MMSCCQVAAAFKLHAALGHPLPSVPSSPLLPQPELRDVRPGRIAVLRVVCSLPDVRGVLQLGQSGAERTALHCWHAWALSTDALPYVTWLSCSGAAASPPGMSSQRGKSFVSAAPLPLPQAQHGCLHAAGGPYLARLEHHCLGAGEQAGLCSYRNVPAADASTLLDYPLIPPVLTQECFTALPAACQLCTP